MKLTKKRLIELLHKNSKSENEPVLFFVGDEIYVLESVMPNSAYGNDNDLICVNLKKPRIKKLKDKK